MCFLVPLVGGGTVYHRLVAETIRPTTARLLQLHDGAGHLLLTIVQKFSDHW